MLVKSYVLHNQRHLCNFCLHCSIVFAAAPWSYTIHELHALNLKYGDVSAFFISVDSMLVRGIHLHNLHLLTRKFNIFFYSVHASDQGYRFRCKPLSGVHMSCWPRMPTSCQGCNFRCKPLLGGVIWETEVRSHRVQKISDSTIS